MKPSKFDELVTVRANEKVQTRIRTFESDIMNAINKLYGQQVIKYANSSWFKGEIAQKILSCLATNKYPSELWREEEANVAQALLATMDEMSKALVSLGKAPNPDDKQSDDEKEII